MHIWILDVESKYAWHADGVQGYMWVKKILIKKESLSCRSVILDGRIKVNMYLYLIIGRVTSFSISFGTHIHKK